MSLRVDEKLKQHNLALQWAVRNNHIDVVSKLLTIQGIDINFENKYGVSIFAEAAANGHTEILRILLDKKTHSTKSLVNALMLAARDGRVETFNLLLTVNGISINAIDKNNTCPLYLAAFNGRNQIVNELLAHDNTDLNITAKDDGKTALIIAQEKSHTRIANKIIATYAKQLLNAPNTELSTIVLDSLKPHKEKLFAALMRLSPADQLKAVKQILEDKNSALAKVFSHGNTLFNNGILSKIKEKHLELTTSAPVALSDNNILEIVITNKQRLNGDVLLQWLNRVDIKLLVPAILDKLKSYKTELLEAIAALPDDQALKMLELVFDESKPDKKNDYTALGKVFWAGHPDINKKRLGEAYQLYRELKKSQQHAVKKPPADDPMKQYNKALHWTTTQGYDHVVSTLLTIPGIDVNATNEHGSTVLSNAAENGRSDIIRVLQANGANINAGNSNFNPLFHVTKNGNIEAFKLLLTFNGVNINATDHQHYTPLHIAAFYGKTEIVNILLSYDNIDLNEVAVGNTALSRAHHFKNIDIVNAIITVYAKQLLHTPTAKLPTAILDHLEPHKEKLFAELKKLDRVKAIRQIIEDKESALASVFWYKCTDLHKTFLEKKYTQFTGIILAEEKTLPAAQAMPTTLAPAISANILTTLITGKGSISGNELLQWLNEVDPDVLTSTILYHAKKFKTPLLDAINALGDNKAKLDMFEKIFDEKVPGKKNDKTALGKVFWAGTPDLYENRLGEAYKCYFALKFPGKTFVKPEKTSIVSDAFTSIFSKLTNKTQTVETAIDLHKGL